MSSFMQNFFGALAPRTFGLNTTASFIPKDNKGGTVQIKGDQAVWLGLRNKLMQKYCYENCFALASVVDRLAEYDLNGQLQVIRKIGKGKHQPLTTTYAEEVKQLFQQPNPLQSGHQFRGQQVAYKKVFGYALVLPLYAKGFPDVPAQMINLPPWCVEAIPTGKLLYQTKVKDIIKEFKISILGQSFTVTSDEVIILEDGFWQSEDDHFMLPQSKLVGMDMALSNLMAAMEADNVLLRKKGPLGFLSHDAAASKDSVAGYIPMTPDQKKEVQEALQQYGMSWDQYLYVISRVPMKWNPMSFDVKALGTKETVVASEKAICHRLGFSYVLYEDTDATYANGENAKVSCYQDNIIPNADRDFAKYAKKFNASGNNAEFWYSFDDVACLQEDKKAAAEALVKELEGLEKQWDLDLITRNEMLEALGMETIPEGNKRKSQLNGKPALAITLGVGGTQSLMELLGNATLSPEAKRKALEILFGFSTADAKALSPDVDPVEDEETSPKEDEIMLLQ